MLQVQDRFDAALAAQGFTGDLTAKQLAYFILHGNTNAAAVRDAEYSFLLAQGAAPWMSVDDAWDWFLTSREYTGDLLEKKLAWFEDALELHDHDWRVQLESGGYLLQEDGIYHIVLDYPYLVQESGDQILIEDERVLLESGDFLLQEDDAYLFYDDDDYIILED